MGEIKKSKLAGSKEANRNWTKKKDEKQIKKVGERA